MEVSPSKPVCPNCGSAELGRFCAACGQAVPTPADYALKSLIVGVFEHVTSYDGRLVSTLRALVLAPGKLTKEHFDGRRATYLSPFRLFLLTNVAAFFLFPKLGITGFKLPVALKYGIFGPFWTEALKWRAELAHKTVEQLSARIDALGGSVDSATIILLIPIFSLGLWLVMAGRGHTFVQHLVFTAHLYTVQLTLFVLVVGFVVVPLVKLCMAHPSVPAFQFGFEALRSLWVQHYLVGFALLPYTRKALQRAYDLDRNQVAWRVVVLTLWTSLVTRAFEDLGMIVALVMA